MYKENFEKNEGNEYRSKEEIYYDREILNWTLSHMHENAKLSYKMLAIKAIRGDRSSRNIIQDWAVRQRIAVQGSTKSVKAISINEVYEIMTAL